ncbi:hypothetical protein Tco_1006257 [Tanacetum coccineum]|uniref:Uncharacterized protein n=1 Tax=Tanacetum coccineum TaxID=301880 RepID=A0ABQ5FI36_9ASTR
MTPPYFNTYQSSYNNSQLQQQFPPSQYGSIHPTQHHSSTYPSQPQFNHSSVPPSYPYQPQMNHQTSYVPQIAYQSPQVSTQPMTESLLADLGFAVRVFSLGDDLIAYLNKAMAFLTVVASSRFPSTNNQLRTSSNPTNQATIQDGRVTVQQVQRRQGKSYYGTSYKSNATSSGGTMQMDMQGLLNATTVKVKDIWLGNALSLSNQGMQHDLGVPDGQAIQIIIPNNDAFQTKELDTYDSYCDDISNVKAVLMANISNYGSNVISEVPHSETYLNDMENQSVHAMQDFEQLPVVDFTDNEIHSTTRFNDLILEVPSDLPKVSLVNAILKKLKFHLAQFDFVVKKRTTPDAHTEGEWGFEHTEAVFNNEIIPFLKSLKDVFNVFDKDLLNDIIEVQTVFDQMEVVVQ